MADKMESTGTRLSVGITAPLVTAAGAALKFALEAEESENLFSVSMGNMEEDARKWSEDLRTNLGLNDVELRKTIGTVNVMAKSMGVSETASYEMAKSLTELSKDLESFYNLKGDVAFEKLRSGITGEAEPLKALGIIVNETTVKMTALNHGIIKQGEELNEQQKVLARYITILEGTTAAQGDLARTIDSPTNMLRIMSDRAETLARTVGEILRPYLLELIQVGNELLTWTEDAVNWFKGLDESTKDLIIGFATFTAVLGPLLVGIGAATKVIAGFLAVVAAIASPVGLAVVAIGTLVAAGVALANNWDEVTNAVSNAWSEMVEFIADHVEMILETFGTLVSWIPGFESVINRARESLRNIVDEEQIKRKTEATRKQMAEMGKTFNELAATTTKDSKEIEQANNKLIESLTKEAKEAVTQDEKTLAKRRELARKRIDLEVETGRKTSEQKINFLRSQLKEVEKESEEETKIRNDMVKEYQRLADEEIKIIRDTKNISRREQMEMMASYKKYYESIGDEGAAAAKRIDDAMQEMNRDVLSTSDDMRDQLKYRFKGIGDDWIDMWESSRKAFGSTISDLLHDGGTLKDGFKKLFDAIGKIITDKFGEIVASKAWQTILSGPSGGGVGTAIAQGTAQGATASAVATTTTTAGTAAAAASGNYIVAGLTAGYYFVTEIMPKISGYTKSREFLDSLSTAATQLANLRTEYLKVIDELSKEEIDDFNKAVDNFFETYKSKKSLIPDAMYEPLLKQLQGQILKLPYGRFAKQQIYIESLSSSQRMIWEAETSAAASEYNYLAEQWQKAYLGQPTDTSLGELEQRRQALYNEGGIPSNYYLPNIAIPSFTNVGLQGGLTSGTITPDFIGSYANGGSFIVNKPTMFRAGENGPEKITIGPNGGNFGGSGNTYVFQGPVIMDEITARLFARNQMNSFNLESERFV